jgi:hypothetical protein
MLLKLEPGSKMTGMQHPDEIRTSSLLVLPIIDLTLAILSYV